MKQFSFLLVFIQLLVLSSAAQDSLVYRSKDTNGITTTADPLIVIKGEEIRNFPATNFLDAVEGLFPWVFGAQQQPGEFLFVLNGHVLANINGISLQDIEEISFTRNNLYGGSLPLSKAGTFFIVTKSAPEGKRVINFNSQFSLAGNRQQSLLSPNGFNNAYSKVISNDVNNGSGNFLSNHVSLAQTGKKYTFYSAGYYNNISLPAGKQDLIVKYNADTMERSFQLTSKGQQQAYGLLVDLTYRFASKIQSGITVNYAHRKTTLDSTEFQTSVFGTIDEAKTISSPFNMIYISAFIKWQPFQQLSNTLSFEYTKSKYESAGNQSADSRLNYFTGKSETVEGVAFTNEGIIIRDEVKYNFKMKGNFKAGLLLNSLWYKPTAETRDSTITTNNGGFSSVQFSWWKATQKIAVVNPAFQFSYKDVITGYAGLGYFIGKKQFEQVKGADKVNTYYGVDLNLKNLFRADGFNVLNFSFNYAKMAMNSSFNPLSNSWLPFSSAFLSSFNYNSSTGKSELAKNEMLSFKLTAGLLKNRLFLSAEWSRLKYDKNFVYTIITPPNSYNVYVADYETAKGVSFFVSGTLIEKKEVKLFSRINFLVPQIKSHAPYPYALNYTEETSLKAGIQNKLVYKNLYLQVNALLNFNHLYPAPVNGKAEKKNDFILNYLLLGYNVPATTKGILKNSTLFIQARNVFVSAALKELYLYDRYAGIGISLFL